MNSSLILWMSLALLTFWCVGLYNRLMRMRARGLSALGSVDKHVRQYAEVVYEHGLDGDSADRSLGPWNQLLTDLQGLDHALKAAKSAPLAAEGLTRLRQAIDTLQSAWRQLHEMPADLAGAVVPAVMQVRWEAITQRVESARSGFNQIAAKYNESLEQFPARLVVAIMGFKPSGML
ncbi:LemA family protein [Candidatus Aalborgicola defluviihabitans]|jgi:LemA protein|uniref:LemA family protein n=1 Tax=Candidatus Aalborgicola defluviihabitans TaxID=3386187 RepID=UPI001E1304FF|nr:LemA family protein [Burkholderiales bacterium]MBK7281521.1 LemA family protein [Burkholderiales bacterium]MBK7315505.1 LemA family protein [Burkholderiales bacterium]